MLEILKINLQLFGEGGDGGDGGSTSATGENAVGTTGDNIPAHIPERAKKYYQKAMEKHSATANAQTKPEQTEETQTTDEPATEGKTPYDELIKGDYKEEHKAYMDKAISERFKKYKGLEETNGKLKGILDIVANKYGVDPNAEDFLDTLNQKIEADDSYYEDYAMKHDISTEEARKMVTMERKVAQIEAQEEARKKQEQMQQHMLTLRRNAEQTKARFPEFELETAMQDEKFRRLCAVTNGDTTSAYMACNWNKIIPAQVSMAAQQAQVQTARAVAANKARPVENGMTSAAPSVVENNFKGMSLKDIRAYADEQRRRGR